MKLKFEENQMLRSKKLEADFVPAKSNRKRKTYIQPPTPVSNQTLKLQQLKPPSTDSPRKLRSNLLREPPATTSNRVLRSSMTSGHTFQKGFEQAMKPRQRNTVTASAMSNMPPVKSARKIPVPPMTPKPFT